MAGNNEGNKITQNTLSRAVNREKKKSKNGQYKQTKQKVDHSTPIPTLPPPKISYQAVNTNIRPISKPSRVTPPRNQNINNSHSSTTKKNGRIKTTIDPKSNNWWQFCSKIYGVLLNLIPKLAFRWRFSTKSYHQIVPNFVTSTHYQFYKLHEK